MKSIVGIFKAREDGEQATTRLLSLGIPREHIDMLVPGGNERQLEAVATTDAEQPGIGKTLGGVVGGAIGAAGGMSLGAAAASLLIPGVGLVIASGLIGAALFGVGGAATGVAAGGALEEGMAEGLPKDELFVYEDALRQGRTVVIALAQDDAQYEAAQRLLEQAGAESINAAREQWWIGLRSAEEEDYTSQGGDFASNEVKYRRGFESALHPQARGKSYDEARQHLEECYGEYCKEASFRRGYDRGQNYYGGIKERDRS